MSTSYDVRIWNIETHNGKTRKSYRVRWQVGKKRFKRVFETLALADSFRSDLVAAARRGEPFDYTEGVPVTMLRLTNAMDWFSFACMYVDMKWSDASPGHRRSIADALVPITLAMLKTEQGMPDGKLVRRALRKAFSSTTRDADTSGSITSALRWIERNTIPVGNLEEPETMRAVVIKVEKKLDGSQAAANTIRRRRITLGNALDYAVEKNFLTSNPLAGFKVRRRTTTSGQVDRRAVVNPVQARKLLAAVEDAGKPGPRLVAFFGLMYYAALRPEEAASLKKRDLSLPAEGWGELRLDRASPELSEQWTDSGQRSEERGLKHREAGVARTVPCPPALTELLHDHLNAYGTARDGRLFRGARDGGRIGSTTYGRVWAQAREAVFTPDIVATPLAKRPYDLRHAAVSTWLNAGVEATRVAEWAGHSVAVLLRVYAKCLDGGEQAARQRVQEALGG